MLFMLSSNHAFFKISSPGLVNENPLKLKTIPAQTSVADQEFHPMTSSSKLNIHRVFVIEMNSLQCNTYK